MNKNHDNQELWRITFGKILRTLFDIYGTNDQEFSVFSELEAKHAITDSAVRKWFVGQRLPSRSSLQIVVQYFGFLSEKQNDYKKENRVYNTVENYFSEQYLSEFYRIRRNSKSVVEFIQETLQCCILNAKSSSNLDINQNFPSTGKTKVVVFDFDGTLTHGKLNQTIWENIWISLGYCITECQDLQLRFIRGDISHEEWCQITEHKFIERRLHKSSVDGIAQKIKLLPGVKETFAMLEKKEIKIYIVSGSIFDVIKKVLGNSVYHYVDGIKANHFFYSDNGILSKIVGTKYDFEGKADFIREISTELQISTKDILFVGNSFNDRFAYLSGARTLCINPKETDPTDLVVWNGCIKQCRNLRDIEEHIYY